MDYGNTLSWLINSSLIATVFITIIYIVRAVIKKKVSPSVLYYMWFLVIIKLIIPYGPESSFSIYNLFNNSNKVVESQGAINSYNNIGNITTNYNNVNTSNDIVEDTTSFTSEEQIQPESGITNPTKEKARIKAVVFYIWIIGVALIASYTIISYINLRKTNKYRNNEEIEKVNNILAVCLKRLNVKRKVTVAITNKVNTPSLCGILNPMILLPTSLISEVNDEELKYILIHELCHLKRGDILVAWIISTVKAVYWFNPAVYFALKTMQNDCEVSCDNMVLSYLEHKENLSYGNTIINVLSYMGKPKFLPGTTSMVASKKTLKDRIRRISKNKKFTLRNVLLGLVVILAIGVIGLTSGKPASQVDEIKNTWSKYIKAINNDDESKIKELKTDDFDTLQFNEGFEEYLKNLENLNYVEVDTIEFQSESSAVVNLIYSYSKGEFVKTSSYDGVLMVKEDNIWKIDNIAWKELLSSNQQLEDSDYSNKEQLNDEENFSNYIMSKGYKIIINSGIGAGIKIPSIFDEVKNEVNVGEIIKEGLEISKGEGLDFTQYLGEIVKLRTLDVESEGENNTAIGLFDDGKMVGFWITKSYDEEGRHISSKIMSLRSIEESSKSEYKLTEADIEDLKSKGDVVSVSGEVTNIETLEKYISSFNKEEEGTATIVYFHKQGSYTIYTLINKKDEAMEIKEYNSKGESIEYYKTREVVLKEIIDDLRPWYAYSLLLDDGREIYF